jgi:hypothetical protein
MAVVVPWLNDPEERSPIIQIDRQELPFWIVAASDTAKLGFPT